MILVTGASGHIGRHLVQKLMTNGIAVRCLIREVPRRQNLPWEDDPGLQPEVLVGTLLDDELLFAACTGVRTIIHLENAHWWGRERDLERIELVGTRNLVAAARAARVGRVILLSHLGASPSSAFTLLRIKGQQEEIIRSSGLAFTVLRSGIVFGPEDVFVNHIAMMLATNPLLFIMPGQGEVVLHPLHIDDLVQCVVNALERIDSVDQTVEIGGPEYVTFRDMLITVMRVTRMYRYVFPIPPYAMRIITRFFGLIQRRTLMTQQWLDILAASRTAHIGTSYTRFGVQPRRFEDTLVEYIPQRRWFVPALRYVLHRRPRGY